MPPPDAVAAVHVGWPVGKRIMDLIAALPKAELHLHIEGTLEPELLLKLAADKGLPPPFPSVQAAKNAFDFGNLQEFLDLYFAGCAVLTTEQDFYELCWAYLRRAAAENIRHTEIMFDPQTHTDRGVAFETVLNGLNAAIADAKHQLGITASLICSFLRHLSSESAMETLEQALPHIHHFAGFGLDSSELHHPPSKFHAVFERARAAGKPVFAHAGEEGPPSYVWEAIEVLQVTRIDHGVQSLEDERLVAHLREAQVPLTVCPLSNLKLKVYSGQLEVKMKELVHSGMMITINSDDPAYFGGYLNANFGYVASACSLLPTQLAQLAKNSFLAATISEEAKRAHCTEVDAVLQAFLSA